MRDVTSALNLLVASDGDVEIVHNDCGGDRGGSHSVRDPGADQSGVDQPEWALYRRALDALPGHCIILSALHRTAPIVFANSAAARDYGYEAAELVGLPFSSLADRSTAARPELEWIQQAIASGPASRTELSVVRRDGSVFRAGMAFAPLADDTGRVTHFICSGRDITSIVEGQRKREQLQEQLYAEMRERERIAIELRLAQKLESVGRLAAGIAHEINTPIQYLGDSAHFLRSAVADLMQLNVIYRSALDRLFGGEGPATVEELVRGVEGSIQREFIEAEVAPAFERMREGIELVANIVRATKEFAHPDTKDHIAADLNRAVETTLLVARNEYKYAATVETDFAELPPVFCNVGEVNQVFLNLIVNAAHAIEAAGRDASTGIISITTKNFDQCVEVAFTDNGCGIPEDNLERIFDPFFTTKQVGKGTGQGLAIARSIVVEKHRGDIRVESKVGEGSRITLRLPVQADSDGIDA